MRVVSLVPAATEMLASIGGAALLVGRSHDSTWPPEVLHAAVLTRPCTDAQAPAAEVDRQVVETMSTHGALYELDEDLLRSLAPDVILTQNLCSVCSVDLPRVHRIASSLDPPPLVLSLDPSTLEDVFDGIIQVGTACGLDQGAILEVARLRDRFWSARDLVNPYLDGPRVAVIEWVDPLYLAGHWTPTLIEAAGGRCVCAAAGEPSRVVAPEDLLAELPDHVIVAPCGVPLEEVVPHLDHLRSTRWWSLLPGVAEGRAVALDGTRTWSRPGPGLVDTFEWLVAWLNDRPEATPTGFPVRRLGPQQPEDSPGTGEAAGPREP